MIPGIICPFKPYWCALIFQQCKWQEKKYHNNFMAKTINENTALFLKRGLSIVLLSVECFPVISHPSNLFLQMQLQDR